MRKRVWPKETPSSFWGKIWTILPETSALISFIVFIASIMQRVESGVDMHTDLDIRV